LRRPRPDCEQAEWCRHQRVHLSLKAGERFTIAATGRISRSRHFSRFARFVEKPEEKKSLKKVETHLQ